MGIGDWLKKLSGKSATPRPANSASQPTDPVSHGGHKQARKQPNVTKHLPGFATDNPQAYQLPDRYQRRAKPKSTKVPKAGKPPQIAGQSRKPSLAFLGKAVNYPRLSEPIRVDKLKRLQLPELPHGVVLAEAIGITPQRLKWLAYHQSDRSRHYAHQKLAKRNGGMRIISIPRPHLAACQRWILTNILQKLLPHEAAHGFVKGRSIITGAQAHVGRACLVQFDLEEFFPTITYRRVAGLFRACGYSAEVVRILALLCTHLPLEETKHSSSDSITPTPAPSDEPDWSKSLHERVLPQGASTSPALANLITRSLDRRLMGLAKKLNWTYTRYADDLTFSTDEVSKERTGYLMHRVRGLVADEQFRLHTKKTRVVHRSQRQTVTGIIVNDKLSVSRQTIRRVRAILHRAQREGLAAQNRQQHPHFESYLLGMIGHIQAVNPVQGQKLKEQFQRLRQQSDPYLT